MQLCVLQSLQPNTSPLIVMRMLCLPLRLGETAVFFNINEHFWECGEAPATRDCRLWSLENSLQTRRWFAKCLLPEPPVKPMGGRLLAAGGTGGGGGAGVLYGTNAKPLLEPPESPQGLDTLHPQSPEGRSLNHGPPPRGSSEPLRICTLGP